MNKENTVFYKSFLACCSVFVIGNGIIVLPNNTADKFTFLGFILSAVIGILIILLLNPLANLILREKNRLNYFEKTLKTVVLLCLSVYGLFTLADTFTDFTRFVSNHIINELSLGVITVFFTVAIVIFAFKRQENIQKFALLCLVFIIPLVVFFFFAVWENFDFKNIVLKQLPDYSQLTNSIKPYIYKVTLPVILLPFYRHLVFGKKHSSSCLIGVSIGFGVLCICILSSVLLFSPLLAGRLSYPYASAISTVTVGNLFTRMDGFSYFIYFASAITKINVCIYVSKKSLEEIRNLF